MSATSAITDIGYGISCFDLHTYNTPLFGACYIIRNQTVTIMETGPSTSAAYILDSLQAMAIDPRIVDFIAVSHIHLDHSGGVGSLLRHMPKARVLVSEKGVEHLVDPSRLIKSARMVYQDQLDALFGVIVPVPAERIIPLSDGDTVRIGPERTLTAYYTPGHAPHHVAFHDSMSNGIFCGEVCGLYLPVLDITSPSTPPPSFNFEDLQKSMDTILRLKPDVLYFAHYGPCREVERCCRENVAKIRQYLSIVQTCKEAGQDTAEATRQITSLLMQELEAVRTHVADPEYMDYITTYLKNRIPRTVVPGLVKYLEKRGK